MSERTGTSTPSWALLVPVKPPAAAKSRLALPASGRALLALAMAADVVAAGLSTPSVALTVVVAESVDGLEDLQRQGAQVVLVPDAQGLNSALVHAAAVVAARNRGLGIASVVADLPAATSQQLDRALAAAAEHDRAFLADAAGTGTTLLASREWKAYRPEHGSHSRQRHDEAGWSLLTPPDVPGLRQDVDTLADLSAAARLGVGRRTADVLASLQ